MLGSYLTYDPKSVRVEFLVAVATKNIIFWMYLGAVCYMNIKHPE
jgi:predicted cobalt transporter CbtA